MRLSCSAAALHAVHSDVKIHYGCTCAYAAIPAKPLRPHLLLPVALSCLTLTLTRLTQYTFQRSDGDSWLP